jgi:hypothetical protein
MQERRNETRFPVKWPLRAGHRIAGCIYGHVVNITGGGLLFVAPGEYNVDELIELEISVNPLFMIRCAANIIRVEKIGETEWAYGATFHKLSSTDSALLLETLVAIQVGETDDALSFRPTVPLVRT